MIKVFNKESILYKYNIKLVRMSDGSIWFTISDIISSSGTYLIIRNDLDKSSHVLWSMPPKVTSK